MIQFLTYPPIREGSDPNPYVRDVESHLSRSGFLGLRRKIYTMASFPSATWLGPGVYPFYFRGDTPTTTVHECTHGINADLRNKFFTGQKVNCFYLLDDNYISFHEPNWRKREVIPHIPPEYRSGILYKTYVSGSNWDDRPLYLWDEWVSYVNASQLGEMYSITNALIFGFYAGAVIKKEYNFGLHDLFDVLCFRLEHLLSGSEHASLYEKLRKFL